MKNTKILNLLIALIALIGGILFIRIFMEDATAIETNVDVQNSVISPLISFSYWLFLIIVAVTLILSMWSLVRHPDNLKKAIRNVVLLGVVLLISYFLADSNVVYDAAGKIQPGGEEGSAVNKWVGTGLWYSILLGGIAGLLFIVDIVKGLIKS